MVLDMTGSVRRRKSRVATVEEQMIRTEQEMQSFYGTYIRYVFETKDRATTRSPAGHY